MAAVTLRDSKDFVNKVRLTVLQYKLSIMTLRTYLPKSDKKDRSQLDISGLCRVLSNEFGLKPKNFNNNWAKLPPTDDKTDGANVFRLRIRRNEVFHSPETGIKDDKFDQIWKELVDIYCKRLGLSAYDVIRTLSDEKGISDDMKNEFEEIQKEWSSELEKLENRIERLEAREENVDGSITETTNINMKGAQNKLGNILCSEEVFEGGQTHGQSSQRRTTTTNITSEGNLEAQDLLCSKRTYKK